VLSGALNGDFKKRKKEAMPVGLVSHVGDILVHRVCWLLTLPVIFTFVVLTLSECVTFSVHNFYYRVFSVYLGVVQA